MIGNFTGVPIFKHTQMNILHLVGLDVVLSVCPTFFFQEHIPYH